MPNQWVPAEVFTEHNGIKIYHVYKNDEVGDGPRNYLFSLSEDSSDYDDPCGFDVRDLSTYRVDVSIQEAIELAIDAGELDEYIAESEQADLEVHI